MWTVKPTAMPVQFLRGRTGTVSVDYTQPPSRNYDGIHRRFCNFSKKSEAESVEGLGQTILLRSNDSNANKPFSKEKKISGSDVLLAIQKARAQKKRSIAGKKKTAKITDMKVSSTEDNGVNYSNVRPLRIKSDWGHKLEEFEKLLTELQETEL